MILESICQAKGAKFQGKDTTCPFNSPHCFKKSGEMSLQRRARLLILGVYIGHLLDAGSCEIEYSIWYSRGFGGPVAFGGDLFYVSHKPQKWSFCSWLVILWPSHRSSISLLPFLRIRERIDIPIKKLLSHITGFEVD